MTDIGSSSNISATPGIIKNLNESQEQINRNLVHGKFMECLVNLRQMSNELTAGINAEEFKTFDNKIAELEKTAKKATSYNKSVSGWSWPAIRKEFILEVTHLNRQLIRVRNNLGLGLDVSKTKKFKR